MSPCLRPSPQWHRQPLRVGLRISLQISKEPRMSVLSFWGDLVCVQVPASPQIPQSWRLLVLMPRCLGRHPAIRSLHTWELIGGTALHKIFIRGTVSEVNFKNGFSPHFHLNVATEIPCEISMYKLKRYCKSWTFLREWRWQLGFIESGQEPRPHQKRHYENRLIFSKTLCVHVKGSILCKCFGFEGKSPTNLRVLYTNMTTSIFSLWLYG